MHFIDQIKAIQEAGFVVEEKGFGHYHVLGGIRPLNWYPEAEIPSIYVNGMVKGYRVLNGNAVDVILGYVRDGELPGDVVKTTRKDGKNRKRRMLRKSAFCRWCKDPLTLETATVDHIIPLSKGGSNRADNLCLACLKCNRSRGNSLAAPKEVV